MNRLQSELHRLYLPAAASARGQSELVDQQGRVRALVLELARPADWDELSRVWRGVQDDLDLPAPAIAVSGVDGFQLWFSLIEPISAAQAQAFLQALCTRYLPDVAPKRLRLMPLADAATATQVHHVQCIPAEQAHTGYWSAFVAAELAPLFADTPWIDSQPGSDGQAGVLRGLLSISSPALTAAMQQLGLVSPVVPDAAPQPTQSDQPRPEPELGAAGLEAQRFLQQVMNDPSVALALRIEAAKALLPGPDERRRKPNRHGMG
jgi:hypothetical protein